MNDHLASPRRGKYEQAEVPQAPEVSSEARADRRLCDVPIFLARGAEEGELAVDLTVLAPFMAKLPFVTWDRYVQADNQVGVYGWIAREDGKADFVVMHIWDTWDTPTFWTSSAQYSTTICEALCGTSEGHIDCQRVEYAGLDLPNIVRLTTNG